jgi:hypothetical protein
LNGDLDATYRFAEIAGAIVNRVVVGGCHVTKFISAACPDYTDLTITVTEKIGSVCADRDLIRVGSF